MDVQNNETPIRYKEVSVNGSADQKHRVQNSFQVAGKKAGNRQKDWFDVMGFCISAITVNKFRTLLRRIPCQSVVM